MALSSHRSTAATLRVYPRDFIYGPLRDTAAGGLLLGQAHRRRKADSMRLVGGQVRLVMAVCSQGALPPHAGHGSRDVPTRDESDAADDQTRCRAAAAGRQRVLGTRDSGCGSWSMMAR